MYTHAYMCVCVCVSYTDTKGQSWPRGTGSVGRGAQGQ